ncbi:hypothetical protein WwAna0706, partial [Wolbachia endosymbiont of Drosophila ananassae]
MRISSVIWSQQIICNRCLNGVINYS